MINKDKVLMELEKNYPQDLSIGEVAEKTKLSRPTTSTWLKVLEAEGKIEISRKIGAAIFYQAKKNVRKKIQGESMKSQSRGDKR